MLANKNSYSKRVQKTYPMKFYKIPENYNRHRKMKRGKVKLMHLLKKQIRKKQKEEENKKKLKTLKTMRF